METLANVLDWHRREEKAAWWEYFRLRDRSAEELFEEPAALSGPEFVENVGGTAKAVMTPSNGATTEA
jgi:hypothetical protein